MTHPRSIYSSGGIAEFESDAHLDELTLEQAQEHGFENEGGSCAGPAVHLYPILDHLRNLTVLSLVGYEEMADLAPEPRIKAFAIVILRQRTTWLRGLYEYMSDIDKHEGDCQPERRALLRALWRLAILHLQRRDYQTFSEYAQRAEAFLEEAFLGASDVLRRHEIVEDLRDYAVMIYGAKTVLEEFQDVSSSQSDAATNSTQMNK